MTGISRRGISRRGVVGASAVGVFLAPFVNVSEAEAAARTKLYTRKRFTPLLKKRFRLVGAGTRTPVRLVRVSDLSSRNRGDDHRFALTFRAARKGPPQGTYQLRRRGFRTTTLFVVPDAHHRTYEVIVFRKP
jgi:hypothetical protein